MTVKRRKHHYNKQLSSSILQNVKKSIR